MGSSRTVRHVRLRGRSRVSMTKVGAALEDALRVSDLPGDDGRLVLVRTLALGGMDATLGTSELPRRLEEAMDACSRDVRHGADVGAARANTVWFRDTLEAHARLAERVLAGEPADEWYWRLAVPGWRSSGEGGIPGALGVIARSLMQLREAPAALPVWCHTVCDAGGAEDLRRLFGAGDGPEIAEAAGLRLDHSGDAWERRRPMDGVGKVPPRTPSVDRGGSNLHGPAPGATRTAATDGEAEGIDVPGHATSVPHGEILDLILREAGRHGVGPSQDVVPPSAPAVSLDASGRTAADGGGVQRANVTRPGPGPRTSHQGIGGVGGHQRGPLGSPPPTASERGRPLPHDGASVGAGRSQPASTARFVAPSTEAGGLPFLINVLSRLDFGDWLGGAPEWRAWNVARRVMTRVLGETGIPEADPAWALGLGRGPAPEGPLPSVFKAPRSWSEAGIHTGARRRTPRGAEVFGGESVVERATGAWVTACETWLRGVADMEVRTLVCRRARLAVTPTHVDAWFPLSEVDLAVRRAGLDIDPGWVPWMRRVVAFHYGSWERFLGEAP